MERNVVAVGVDLGTGSVRAFVMDATGRRLGGARYAYAWRVGRDGALEVDAEPVLDLVYQAMDRAVEAIPGDAQVAAVGFSGLWHTLVGVDGSGSPLTPVFGWGDTRSAAAAGALRAELDPGQVHARTGAVLHSSYLPARLRWLREVDPTLFGRVHRWLSLPELLWHRLTGRFDVDLSMAAGSGLLDQARMEWDAEILAACGVRPGQLGRIATDAESSLPGEAVGSAQRWPTLRTAVWRLPVGDGACATIGSGARDHSRVALSVGTSAAVRVLTEGEWRPPPQGLWRYRLTVDRALLGGALSNGGLVRSWLESVLRLPATGPDLERWLTARDPGAHGLTMLPFLAGERSPDWPLDATAAYAGLRSGHTALDLLQAGMEAVAYRLVLLLRKLRAAVPESVQIVASGGALRASPAWAQLLADAVGEPLLLTDDPETSSRGAALLALEAADKVGHGVYADPPMTRIEPDAARHMAHAAALEQHVRVAALLGYDAGKDGA